VKLWDSANGALLWASRIPTDSRDLVFSADGQWLYDGGWFDLFRWNVATGELQVIDTDHHGIINNLSLLRPSILTSTAAAAQAQAACTSRNRNVRYSLDIPGKYTFPTDG